MNNVVYMQSRTDWFVMNMVKKHIQDLKKLPMTEEVVAAIARNEAALRSFFEDIRGRSSQVA